jgi:biotin carboxyl carrier protein
MFVEVGNTIAKGDVLCVIEAMKLLTKSNLRSQENCENIS